MTLGERARTAVKRIVLGPAFHQQCILGMRDPQSEIAVELRGIGAPIDVTKNHTLACAAPFAIAIGFGGVEPVTAGGDLSLQFRERAGRQRLLGTLRLQPSGAMRVDEREIHCFTVQNPRNYCLSAPRLWMRYAQWTFRRWRRPPEVPVSAGDAHAMAIFFICPRPVVLVSVAHEESVNLFPMNLMGPLGNGYFGFALNHTRPAAALVERAGRLALSSVPFELSSAVRQLGKNHRRESIDCRELPFPTKPSTELGFPVPSCALRVREAELVALRKMGSHTLFLARILRDEQWRDGLQFFMVHGMYGACRDSDTRNE